jgi:hypothetical protein
MSFETDGLLNAVGLVEKGYGVLTDSYHWPQDQILVNCSRVLLYGQLKFEFEGRNNMRIAVRRKSKRL